MTILTVTPNAAIDRTLIIPQLTPGEVHRASSMMAAAGGKGVNVARAITILGGEAVCAGIVGGLHGQLFVEIALREGLRGLWTWVGGETRFCTIVVDEAAHNATVINERGLTLQPGDWSRFEFDVLKAAEHAAVVALCGSLPAGVGADAFAALVSELITTGKPIWVDTSGAALRAALNIPGVHIKVNDEEIGEVLDQPIPDPEAAVQAARSVRAMTGGVVVVTMGARGAVLAHPGGDFHAAPPKIKVKSAVGSGDSFLAGLLVGSLPGDALRRAVAAGAANALTVGGGSFSPDDFQMLYDQTTLTQFD